MFLEDSVLGRINSPCQGPEPPRCLRNERGLEPGESRKARTLGGNEEPWRPCEELFQGRWQDTDA